jgi:hypothetical protein
MLKEDVPNDGIVAPPFNDNAALPYFLIDVENDGDPVKPDTLIFCDDESV